MLPDYAICQKQPRFSEQGDFSDLPRMQQKEKSAYGPSPGNTVP
jgi:hypothetical protein